MNKQLKEQTPDIPDSSVKKIILYGAGGTGKSTSIATTLIDAPANRRIVYLMTERNAVSGLEYGLQKHGINPAPGQIVYVFPQEKKKAFVDLERAFALYEQTSKTEALKGQSATTQGKENYGYINKILKTLAKFTGQDFATGETIEIGNVGDLTSSDILVIDGLSPIGNEIWNSMVGDKIAISMTDYGPPQRAMYLLFAAIAKLDCHVILLAHEKEVLNDSGTLDCLRVNTWVGNSNYETLMGLWTDVVYAYKQGNAFKWAGQRPKTYTIARNIPAKDNLEPSFHTHGVFSTKQ
jgi:hypothetical protein